MKNDILIGEFARKFRVEKLNISQQEMASRIGVTRQTINNFELGRFHSYKAFDGYMRLGMPYPDFNSSYTKGV